MLWKEQKYKFNFTIFLSSKVISTIHQSEAEVAAQLLPSATEFSCTVTV